MSIGPPIPEIQHFQNLTLKIQGQGPGWGERWKSQSGCNILSTHIPFVPCQSALPFLSRDTAFSKFDLENPRSRSNDHDVAQNFKWYKSFQWFQRYGFRKVWPKCCLIWQVSGQWACPYGANGQITMTLHNYRSSQVHKTLNGVNPSSSFRDMRSAKSRPNLWQIWQVFGPWESPYGANRQMTMSVHN